MRSTLAVFGVSALVLGSLFACGDDPTSDDPGAGSSSGATSSGASGSSGAASSSGASGGGSSSGAGGDGGRDGASGDGAAGEECGIAAPGLGFVGAQTLDVGGASRGYQLFLPPGYDQRQRYPVILVFHGDGGSGAGVRASFDIEGASGGAAIVAYPNGQGGTWQIDNYAALMKDVAFVDALATELTASYCGDGRVFLAGFSKGAYFVNQAACRTSVTLTGIASHSGGGPYGTRASEYDAAGKTVCPSPPVAAMQLHGNPDSNVPLSEGVTSRDYWRAANACAAGTAGVSPAPCVAYNGCARSEIWCAIPGIGHSVWSSAPTAIWDFFRAL